MNFKTHKFWFLPILMMLAMNSKAQSVHDLIGIWLIEDKTGQIEIYKAGDAYYGKIVSGTSAQKYDVKNPEQSKRSVPLIGLTVIRDLIYNNNLVWDGGTVYDPNNGKTYDCNIELIDKNSLKITGYIGFSWIGRSELWKRVDVRF